MSETVPACPLDGAVPDDGVLIGYIGIEHRSGGTTVGAFRPLGLIDDQSLQSTPGDAIRDQMPFWKALNADEEPVKLTVAASFWDRRGRDHCVFHAQPNRPLPRWTLLTSEPAPGLIAEPSVLDWATFEAFRSGCVLNGQCPEAPKGEDGRRQLLAVSDFDQDGLKEYWATQPYRWDTGIRVWEKSATGWEERIAVCTGCSD